jgi:hypothetical protein
VRGWVAEKDQFPKRDRPKASPLASPQQPMSHVFSRGQVHQKVFGRSPRVKDSATGFYRYRRAADPSSFFRNALDNCERLIRTPSRASISARRRAIVQFVLSATGSSSNGVTTRNATALFTGSGPGATRVFNASTPPLVKSPRQRRTVSSRTPNASAIRGLLQPDSVNRTARALSASPRSRDVARTDNEARCSPFAVTGDFPLTPHLSESVLEANRTAVRWSTYGNPLRVRPGSFRCPGQPSQHESDGREQHICTGFPVEAFPVLGEATAPVKPRESSFDHPSFG